MMPNPTARRTALVIGVLWIAVGFVRAAADEWHGTIEERIASQRALEQVYWHHRIWPQDNVQPRPSFESVVPDSLLRTKVEDTLRKSRAIEIYWQRRLDARELEAEIARMARSSKDPDRLAELWEALGDDPRRIAECLARPMVADRMIRSLYAQDARFHGELRDRVESIVASQTATSMKDMGGDYSESLLVRGGPAGERGSTALDESEWEEFVSELARNFGDATERARAKPARPDVASALERLPVSVLGRVREDGGRLYVTAVLEKAPDRIRVATVSWAKRTFEDWWARTAPTLAAELPEADAPDSLPALSSSGCNQDTWTSMDADMPLARATHAAVWTGTEMIVWGGAEGIALDSGGRYDPATDSWTLTSLDGAPLGAEFNVAFWTGTEMLVLVPADYDGNPLRGARYSPLTDTWVPISVPPADIAQRQGFSTVWTGTELIVWGGTDIVLGEHGNFGARYRPSNDTWTPTSLDLAPAARSQHTAVWADTEMIVWGGMSRDPDTGIDFAVDSGGRYDPTTDAWSDTKLPGAPTARAWHTAAWTGTHMVIWGGDDGAGNGLVSGGLYRLSNNTWSDMDSSAAPSARSAHASIWTGTRLIVWGGADYVSLLNDGGSYDPIGNAWTPTSAVGAPEPRSGHTAVWAGGEMIVWGGADASGFLDSGGRYNPVAGTWLPTLDTSSRPGKRMLHGAVWTGSEMIVWGGEACGGCGIAPSPRGSRYDPATDGWSAVNPIDAPSDRFGHTRVWTGTEMIVWGGHWFDGTTGQWSNYGDGGRYDPAADTWSATAPESAPSPRAYHSAVWTGSRMIVWGGSAETAGPPQPLDDGESYDPAADAWDPISAVGAPATHSHTAVWTGREVILWGGATDGARYDPFTDTWRPMAASGIPLKFEHTAVWTGREMIVWGGQARDMNATDTGGRYDPTADTWTPTTATGVVAKSLHTAVWACGRMIVWGGREGGPYLTSDRGYAYDPVDDTWTPTSTAGAPFPRQAHAAVANGTQMIVFGGYAAGLTGTGALYCACDNAGPLEQPRLVVDRPTAGARLSWYAIPEATGYDVVRGSLVLLRASDGNFAVATQACLANDVEVTWAEVLDDPPNGAGFWYLIRPVRPAFAGSYDSGLPSQVGMRDAEIASSSAACP